MCIKRTEKCDDGEELQKEWIGRGRKEGSRNEWERKSEKRKEEYIRDEKTGEDERRRWQKSGGH